ncbi:MAG: glmU [Rickettsiaceae bacterium]|jgi:UDP-N-acetylglucosamine pyrophosphorylase|nr:glmU [Rickettsiaceae bacterium]
MNFEIVILAAGHGSRMNSQLPKVMHKLLGKPMLEYVLNNAILASNEIVLVHSSELEEFLPSLPLPTNCRKVIQFEKQGTGHAVKVALDYISKDKPVIVLYGDNPLISTQLIKQMMDKLVLEKLDLLTLAFSTENPAEYGRIVTDEAGHFQKIVEYRDATTKERAIKLCNSGVIAFGAGVLHKYIPMLRNDNAKKEYYLTDMVSVVKDNGGKISYLVSEEEVVGVNTLTELSIAEQVMKEKLVKENQG